MNLWIITGIGVLIAISVILLITYLNLKDYNRFQQTMKVGDKCSVYIGAIKTPAVITAIFDNVIIIEDQEGDAHSFYRKDIYPPQFFLP